MKTVTIKEKLFEIYLTQEVIEKSIDEIANQMRKDLDGENPLFLAVLNGSFMFASELMKRLNMPANISFVKLASYSGISSTGSVKEIIGLTESIEGRTVVIIEDIVDTGHTMYSMIEMLNRFKPKAIKVATLLYKPDALQVDVPLDYVAKEIPTDFIVGYGLDYDGFGRNLPDIYKIKQ